MFRTLAALICLTVPAAAGLLDQVPVESVTLRGEYTALVSCAYGALDRVSGAGIKKIDLQGSSRLAMETGGVRYWELVFTPAGKGTTRVDFSQVQTLWGTIGAKEVMPAVRSCAL